MEDTTYQILNQNMHKYDELYNQLFPETIYENSINRIDVVVFWG